MLKKSLVAAIGVATLIGSGSAMATAWVHPANTESGSVYHGAEYGKVDGKLARVDTWNTQAGTGGDPRADDTWEYQAGDAGWQLRQHRYDFVGGRLLHTDKIPHNTPKPKFSTDETYFSDGHSLRPR